MEDNNITGWYYAINTVAADCLAAQGSSAKIVTLLTWINFDHSMDK